MASYQALPFMFPALHVASRCSPAAVITVINYVLMMLCVTLTLISSHLLVAPGTPEISRVEQQALVNFIHLMNIC